VKLADALVSRYRGDDEEHEPAMERSMESHLGEMLRKALAAHNDEAIYEAVCSMIEHENTETEE
jgi:hypothetical protein